MILLLFIKAADCWKLHGRTEKRCLPACHACSLQFLMHAIIILSSSVIALFIHCHIFRAHVRCSFWMTRGCGFSSRFSYWKDAIWDIFHQRETKRVLSPHVFAHADFWLPYRVFYGLLINYAWFRCFWFNFTPQPLRFAIYVLPALFSNFGSFLSDFSVSRVWVWFSSFIITQMRTRSIAVAIFSVFQL